MHYHLCTNCIPSSSQTQIPLQVDQITNQWIPPFETKKVHGGPQMKDTRWYWMDLAGTTNVAFHVQSDTR